MRVISVNKTIVINAVLTFAYFFTSALVLAPDKLTVAFIVSAVAAGVRGAIGVILASRGSTLPMDQSSGQQ